MCEPGINKVTLTLATAAWYQKITRKSQCSAWIGTILFISQNERLENFVRFDSYLKLTNLVVKCELFLKNQEGNQNFSGVVALSM